MKNWSFLHPEFLLLQWFCLRCNIKHSTQCFMTRLISSKFVENTPLRVVFYTLFSVFHLVMKHCVSCLIYYFIVVLRTWFEHNAHTIMSNVKMVNWHRNDLGPEIVVFFFCNKLVSPGMAIFPFTVRLNQQPRATYSSCLCRRAPFRNQTGVNTLEYFVHFL